MIKHGILDPTKVVRCALENAVSVASMLLTTEAIVADIQKTKPPQPLLWEWTTRKSQEKGDFNLIRSRLRLRFPPSSSLLFH